MVSEIERSTVMGRDDLPDLDEAIARGGNVPKTKPNRKAAVAPKPDKVKPERDYGNPPGIEVAPGETLFNVHFQWAGLEGIFQIPAKTEEAAIDILAGHFRRRCKIVAGR